MNKGLIARIATPVVAAIFMVGCAAPAPGYRPLVDNVEILKNSANPVALGKFTVKAGAPGATSIGLRASNMVTPVGSSYADYLADALRQELVMAGKLDPKSQTEISGELLKNDIAAGGLSTNSGEIEARFVVRDQTRVRYDKTQRSEMTWDSSFVGAIAIPKAREQYPLLVQQLLGHLMSDADFQAALK